MANLCKSVIKGNYIYVERRKEHTATTFALWNCIPGTIHAVVLYYYALHSNPQIIKIVVGCVPLLSLALFSLSFFSCDLSYNTFS